MCDSSRTPLTVMRHSSEGELITVSPTCALVRLGMVDMLSSIAEGTCHLIGASDMSNSMSAAMLELFISRFL